jgi:hypothetical protein
MGALQGLQNGLQQQRQRQGHAERRRPQQVQLGSASLSVQPSALAGTAAQGQAVRQNFVWSNIDQNVNSTQSVFKVGFLYRRVIAHIEILLSFV